MDFDEDSNFIPGITMDSNKLHFNMDIAVQETLLKILQNSVLQGVNGNHYMRFRELKQVKLILESKMKPEEIQTQDSHQKGCLQILLEFNKMKSTHGIDYDEVLGYTCNILKKPLWKRDNKIPGVFYDMELKLEQALDEWDKSLWCVMTRLGLCFIGQKKYDISGM